LGTSAAVPSRQRGFSCIGVQEDEDIVLMDCGDGAIRNVLRFDIDLRRVSSILISHYHSDHLSGLTQIIETMGMKRRTEDLTIFGPTGLKEYFAVIQKTTNVAFNRLFQIKLTELSPKQEFFTQSQKVMCFEMDHTIPCLGYRLESRGKVIAFTGDTQACPSVEELGIGSDIFIHEATFLQKEVELAQPTKHSTPKEAAEGALVCKTQKLVLTHVNDDHETPEEMISEAEKIFEKVLIAYDGLKIQL
jgi:ribonuclease Z